LGEIGEIGGARRVPRSGLEPIECSEGYGSKDGDDGDGDDEFDEGEGGFMFPCFF